MIIFRNISEQVETSITLDKDANLSVVVDTFVNFVRLAGYECDAQSIIDLLEDKP